MARDVSALSSAHTARAQIPWVAVQIEIPSDTVRVCDLDVSLWIDPSTNAVDLVPGGSRVEFVPDAGLVVPRIERTESLSLAPASIRVSNLPAEGTDNGPWTGRVAANNYYDALVTVWRGNLSPSAGAHPDAIAASGAVVEFVGRVDTLEAEADVARIQIQPHAVDHTATLPRRRYTLEDFPFCPKPGATMFFGKTSEPI